MRRSILRWAMSLAAVMMPAWAVASDQETAQQIADALRGSGQLVDYSIGVKYENGTTWLLGRVASDDQAAAAQQMAEQLPMVRKVVNNLEIKPTRAPGQPAAPQAAETGSALKNFFTGKKVNGPQPARPEDPLARHESAAKLAPAAEPPRGEQAAASRMSKFQDQLKNALGLSEPELRSAPEAQLTAYEDEDAPAGPVRQNPAARANTAGRLNLAARNKPAAANTAATVTAAPAATVAPNTAAATQAAPQRVAANPNAAPRPISVARATNVNGGPIGPIQGAMGGPSPALASHGTPAYDQPHLPNHAWPSYAAYPNYAGVTYPKQYSPTAWPYIGPFYPYPQVPLGWRRVSLEWDDGWWFLDFSNRRESRSWCHH